MTDDERLARLSERMRTGQQTQAECLDAVRSFLGRLRTHLTETLGRMRTQGVAVDAHVETLTLPGDLRGLSFQWDGNTVLLKPMPLASRPNASSSASTACGQNQLTGRLVVFVQLASVVEPAAVAHIHVRADGRWCFEGLGYPILEHRADDAALATFAVTLLDLLSSQIKRQHKSLDSTSIDTGGAAKRRIGFTAEVENLE